MEKSQTNATNAKCGHWVTSLSLVPKLIIRLSNPGEAKQCNQCNYASSQAGHFSRLLKTHSGENVAMHRLRQAN